MPGMKRGFAQWCAAYANLIPGVGPLRYARAAVNLGNWVNWSAQFIPPHVMKRISQTPIGRLLYGQNTVAYWTSVGAKIARIIQHMDFEGTLRQALEARLAGDDAKAEALECCATMARHALEDGVLLTYNQQLADDYLKGGLQRLFDKYHLKYDDDRRHIPIPAKIAKRAQDYRETLRQRLLSANAIKDPKKRIAALAAVDTVLGDSPVGVGRKGLELYARVVALGKLGLGGCGLRSLVDNHADRIRRCRSGQRCSGGRKSGQGPRHCQCRPRRR